MSRFSDEEREQILAESRRLIEDGIDAEHEQSMYEPRGDERAEALAAALREPTETLNSRHRRELAERDREWERERAERLASQQEAAAVPGWVTQLRTEIEEARSSLFESVIDGICQVVAEMKSRGEKRLEDALRPLRDELKVAIAKAAVAGDCVVRAADGAIDTFASERKNRSQFRNAMRSARAAASASEGMTIDGSDAMKRAMN